MHVVLPALSRACHKKPESVSRPAMATASLNGGPKLASRWRRACEGDSGSHRSSFLEETNDEYTAFTFRYWRHAVGAGVVVPSDALKHWRSTRTRMTSHAVRYGRTALSARLGSWCQWGDPGHQPPAARINVPDVEGLSRTTRSAILQDSTPHWYSEQLRPSTMTGLRDELPAGRRSTGLDRRRRATLLRCARARVPLLMEDIADFLP